MNDPDHEDDETRNQLWVMVKIDDFFRAEIHERLEEELAALIEGQGLGEFDGSSSGAHQFDMNFAEVENFDAARSAVVDCLTRRYPQMEFVVSDAYETTFDDGV